MVISESCIHNYNNSNVISGDINHEEIINKFQKFFIPSKKSKLSHPENQEILSEREIEILKEVAIGRSNKEISSKLFISPNTVISHRKNITDKLGIKTISGLTVYAIMNEIIEPEDVKF
ncbi:LuxR C-terminal-related transcriptional regulator [Halosquirtibacter laminarini]|uniref:LuxR C-terminal-related transcriptional regulator n=2 Tax=Halosquirtibacter laminarini TaxID=3374600 RepID=A0AC61NLG0_9BACT|nr:LuxR C-terminal-related transcriptional regulator [Prolixibacteraceae bacterium]